MHLIKRKISWGENFKLIFNLEIITMGFWNLLSSLNWNKVSLNFFANKKTEILFLLAENLGFDSIEEYVRKYNLFNRAMKLRTLSRDMRVELASAWAEILEETGHQVRFLNALA